jgi:hypothetical protein
VTAVAVNDLAILASRPARKLGAWEALTQACQAHPSRSDYRGELGRVVTFEVDDPDALVAELTGGGVPRGAITIVEAADATEPELAA